MDDRLYRSVDDRMLAGVAGGVAERIDADPSIIRIVWALLIIFTGGLALVAYVVMAVVVPPAPDTWSEAPEAPVPPVPPSPGEAARASASPPDPDAPTAATDGSWLVGTAAATVGTLPATGTPPSESSTAAGAAGAAATRIAPRGQPVPRAADGRPRRERSARESDDRGPLIGGIVLIAIGAFFLLRQFIPAIDLGSWWPLILVGIGVVLVVASIAPDRRSD